MRVIGFRCDLSARRASRVLVAVGVAVSATLAAGSARALEWEGDLRLQMNDGGEKIGSVKYSNGSISDLNAGTYFTIGAGAAIVPLRLAVHAVEVGAMLGFASWSTGPDNTDDRLKLVRFPMELLAYYRFDWPNSRLSLRAGGGLVYHVVPGLSGSGSLSNVDIDMDNGLGWKAEIRGVYEIFAVGFGFTSMRYDVTGQNVSFDASSFGANLGIVFPPIGAPAPAAPPAAQGSGAASLAPH